MIKGGAHACGSAQSSPASRRVQAAHLPCSSMTELHSENTFCFIQCPRAWFRCGTLNSSTWPQLSQMANALKPASHWLRQVQLT